MVELFSREEGRVGLIARGVKRSKSAGNTLQPFIPLFVSWSGRGELMTLRHMESAGRAIALSGTRLFSALYVNELTMRLVHRFDPHPDLFDLYTDTLTRLAEQETESCVLREYELGLLEALGYGLLLTHEAGTGDILSPDRLYHYDFEHGPVRADDMDEGVCIHGQTLLDLEARQFDNARTGKEAKQLMRAVFNHYLNGVPLKSREYFMSK